MLFLLPSPMLDIKIPTKQTNRDFWKEFLELDTVFLFQRNGILYLTKAPWEPQTLGPTGFSSCRNSGSWNSPRKNHTEGQTKLQWARTTILTVCAFTTCLRHSPLVLRTSHFSGKQIFLFHHHYSFHWIFIPSLSWSELLVFLQSCQDQMHIYLKNKYMML